MTNEEKQLLLKVLCEQLPYGVKVAPFSEDMKCHSEPFTLRQIFYNEEYDANSVEGDNDISSILDFIKPYLRPLSSMTEEEFHNSPIYGNDVRYSYKIDKDGFHFIRIETYDNEVLDWLNAHHFDYRGLIEKGLALEAKEGMYKTE